MRLNQSILLSLCLSAFISASPALANNLSNGISFYKAKDYLMASKLLEKATIESPRNWRAHYYLANAQMALGRFNTATYHYELARDLTTNRNIQRSAGQAIVRMENLRINSNIASVSREHNQSSGSIDHQAELNDHKHRILAEAEARAKGIEAAAERQIKAEKENSNWRALTPSGEMVMSIPWQREQDIRQEAAAKAAQIRRTAQRSADNVY
ncbi:MAG: tetratricopeptide repeat protein [Candidatus Melainabacteria bacterium]|nr:tetratricopeptide repeat protein [Candidatus Melainabacteria bacterium]